MFKAWAAAALLLLAQPAAAADAPGLDRNADCPDKAAHDTSKAYGARALNGCQVSWTRLVDARQTGGATQDEYIKSCARRCGANRNNGLSGATLALIVVGLAAVGGAAAAAGGGGHPASP